MRCLNRFEKGLLTQTWAFLGTSLPLKTQAHLKKLGYYGSFR